MTVSISRIVIAIGDKEISLTPDEAKDLRDALDTVLSSKPQQVVERIIEQPRWIPLPYIPPYPYRPSPWWGIRVGDIPLDGTVSPEHIGTVIISSLSNATTQRQA
jgi:hypothetical protein